MAIIEVDTETPRQLQVVADILATAKKVVVITGAGISTNCGIPVSRLFISMDGRRIWQGISGRMAV